MDTNKASKHMQGKTNKDQGEAFYQILSTLDSLVPDISLAQGSEEIFLNLSVMKDVIHMLLLSAVNIQTRFLKTDYVNLIQRSVAQIHYSASLTDVEL